MKIFVTFHDCAMSHLKERENVNTKKKNNYYLISIYGMTYSCESLYSTIKIIK